MSTTTEDNAVNAPNLMSITPELRTFHDLEPDDEDRLPGLSDAHAKLTDTPALLLCSKQIYSEASSIYYRCSIFDVSQTVNVGDTSERDYGVRWLQSIPAARRALLTEVHLGLCGYCSKKDTADATAVAVQAHDHLAKIRQNHLTHEIVPPVGALKVTLKWSPGFEDEVTNDPMRTVQESLAQYTLAQKCFK